MSNPTFKQVTVLEPATGKVILTSALEERPDGTLWAGGNPLLNLAASGMTKEELTARVKAKQFDQIPARAFMKIGVECEGRMAMPVEEAQAIVLAAAERERTEAQAKLEAAVPGVTALREAKLAHMADVERYSRAFDRMMGDGNNDGCRPPRGTDPTLADKVKELEAASPRAVLYLAAKADKNAGAGCAKALEEGKETEAAAAIFEADKKAWLDRVCWD